MQVSVHDCPYLSMSYVAKHTSIPRQYQCNVQVNNAGIIGTGELDFGVAMNDQAAE